MLIRWHGPPERIGNDPRQPFLYFHHPVAKLQPILCSPLAGNATGRFLARRWSDDGRAPYSRWLNGAFPDFDAAVGALAPAHGFHVVDGELAAQAYSVLVGASCLMCSTRVHGTGFDSAFCLVDPRNIGLWGRKGHSDM